MSRRNVSAKNKIRRRKALEMRYGRTCWLCHAPIRTHQTPTLDHVVPLSKGGVNATCNLRLAHKHCNEKRGNGPPPVLELTEKMMLIEEMV